MVNEIITSVNRNKKGNTKGLNIPDGECEKKVKISKGSNGFSIFGLFFY